MQKLFGFKKIGALSVAGLVSFVAIDAYAQGIPGVATQSDCFNRYTTLVPKANQVTWDGEGQYCLVTVCLDGYAPNADGSDCVVVSQSGGATCGVNLFNPMILTEADFTLTQRNNGEYDATGSWEHLNTYVSNYPFTFMPNKAYSVSYSIECPEEENESVGNTYLTFKLSNGSYVDTYTNVCSGVDGGTRGVTINMPANTTAVGMAVRNVAGTNVSGHEFKISNVMVALSNQSGFVSYNPCIKLATTKMTETRMAAVENRLTGVRNKINTLITQMQTNSNGIGNLQTEKQTRPNASCPVDKKCLLVKDRDNNDNWYEITDCDEHAVLGNVGTTNSNVNNPIYGPGEPYGYSPVDTSYTGDRLMCRTALNSVVGCQSGEWVSAYNMDDQRIPDKIIFGTARRVAIAETSKGDIVTLPNNVQSGEVCVCKATRYRLYDTDTSAFGDSEPITTDQWVVAGFADTDENCLIQCGNDYTNYKQNYYVSISNTCSAAASEAQMCRYYPFFGTVASLVGATGYTMSGGGSYAYGSVREDGTTWAGCNSSDTGPSVIDTGHCGTGADNRGTWVTKYYSGSNQTDLVGYIYGFGGYVNVPEGTAVDSVIDVNVNDVATTLNGQNAAVCVIKGYKADGDASDTNLTTTKAYVAAVGDLNDTNEGGVRRDGCGEASVMLLGTAYSDLANMCFAY